MPSVEDSALGCCLDLDLDFPPITPSFVGRFVGLGPAAVAGSFPESVGSEEGGSGAFSGASFLFPPMTPSFEVRFGGGVGEAAVSGDFCSEDGSGACADAGGGDGDGSGDGDCAFAFFFPPITPNPGFFCLVGSLGLGGSAGCSDSEAVSRSSSLFEGAGAGRSGTFSGSGLGVGVGVSLPWGGEGLLVGLLPPIFPMPFDGFPVGF